MPQLTHGARQKLDELLATVADIDTARQLAYQIAVSNPHRAQDQQIKIGTLTDRLRLLIRELEPLLERQAPQYEARLAALEMWKKEIEEGRRVVPFRKEA